MDGELIGKRRDTQESPFQLIDCSPETIAILLLDFAADRGLHDSDAHLFGEVRSLAHDLILEVWRELIVAHAYLLSGTADDGKQSRVVF